MSSSSNSSSTSLTKPVGAIHQIAPARLNGVKGRADMLPFGTWIWLASDLMFFAALFAAYFTIREVTNSQALASGEPSMWQTNTAHLDLPFAAVNTLILVLSSVTCQLGVHAAEHGKVKRTGGLANLGSWGMREWYTLTFIMGSIFIAGQVTEYANLVQEGYTLSTNVYWSLFYLATGFHGLHVTAGLILFLFVLGRTFMARTFTHEQAINAVVVSYYWHFVDFVWIILFTAIYILK